MTSSSAAIARLGDGVAGGAGRAAARQRRRPPGPPPRPCWRGRRRSPGAGRLASAASESIVSAGAKQMPAPSEVSDQRGHHHAPAPAPTAIADHRARRRSRARPRRACAARPGRSSDPTIGARAASSAAPAMKPPAISAWPPPRSSIRSGTSTSTAPNISEGTATKAVADEDRPADDRRRHLAQRLALRRPGLGQASRESGEHDRRSPSTAPKTTSVPTSAASAPSAGPNRAPATAVPSAVPITEPRRSGGAVVISQVSAPDQISAPATPWTKRAASSRSDLLGEAEDEAGDAEQEQPADHGAARPEPGRDAARPAARRAGCRPRRRRRGPPPRPCSARARRRSRAAAARSPRRRRRRRRPSPRRG